MKRIIIAALMASVAMPAAAQQVPALGAYPSDGTVNRADGTTVPLGKVSFPPQIQVGPELGPLTAKERRALKLSKARINNKLMPTAGADGVVRFVYGHTEPSVVCAPGRWCMIELEPGERIIGANGQLGAVELTDAANWFAKPIVYGSGKRAVSAVAVSPKFPSTQAMVIIGTDRGRLYQVNLRSTKTEWVPKVGFTYPDDEARRAAAEYRKAVEAPAATTDISALDFGFTVSGDAPWRPEQVYSDGQRTVIVLPEGVSDLPVLVGIGDDGGLFRRATETVLNYQMISPTKMLVEGVFNRAALVSGVGSDQVSVEIRRRS